jgi:hypothetical protein
VRDLAASARAQARRGAIVLALLLALLLASLPALASESELEDRPPPSDVEEAGEPLRGAFRRVARGAPLLPGLARRLRDLPPFLRDTQLGFHWRTFYFDRRKRDGRHAEALASGGWLAYHSGWWRERVAAEWKLFTSQKLYGPDRRDGTLLLRPGQNAYTVGAAVANLKLRHEVTTAVLYRQELDLPFVNREDSRLTPNTFQGAALLHRGERVGVAAGYLTHMKRRNDDDFESMSEVAGGEGGGRGMLFAGARVAPAEDFSLGAIDYWVEDTLNTVYAEASGLWKLGRGVSLKLEAQLTDQRSVGAKKLGSGSYDAQRLGGRLSLGWGGWILRLAGSTTDAERAIVSPWGSDPSYLSLMQEDFRRAGEDAWLVGLSSDFSETLLPGLTAALNLARGTGARNPDGSSARAIGEVDLTLDYRIKQGMFRGLWLRLRGSIVDDDAASRTSNDLRVILNYDVPLL